MALRNEEALPEGRRLRSSPVEFITENGFSIVRLCELDPSVQDAANDCRFVVRNPNGWERHITVEFDEQLVELIQQRRRSPLSISSSFWLECGERELATYLNKNNAYPGYGRLILSSLASDALLLATYWID